MKIRRLMKDMNRRNQNRRRSERRMLGSHERWSLLARLKLGQCLSLDGGLSLLRSSERDLFIMVEPREPYKAHFIHPRWL